MQVSSRLVHYIPDGDLSRYHLAMASPYVSDRVCAELLVENQQALRTFLAVSTGHNELGVLRGNLFESYTHLMHQRGGTVQYLDTGMAYLDTGMAYRPEQSHAAGHWLAQGGKPWRLIFC